MEKTTSIIRRSIYTLLKDFHYFTNNPTLVLLPFSVSILVFQSFFVPRIQFLDLNPCQLIFIYVITLPFALSSLLVAKASIVQYLDHNKTTISSIYKPLLLTYLCNILLTIIINIAIFGASNFIGLSSKNHVFLLVSYMVLTNTMIIFNLSLIVAGMDNCNSYKAIKKACLLRKSTNSMALMLTFPIYLVLGALFRYRIVRAYHFFGRAYVSLVVEGLVIAYMFSLVIVLETIVCYLFINSCYSQFELVKENSSTSDDSLYSLEEIA